ncbi:MAG: hypothetical protein Q7U96_03110, partial [Chloroflexota bacterium]|nr:hypothetical protein [Chloroflexota bacterium]
RRAAVGKSRPRPQRTPAGLPTTGVLGLILYPLERSCHDASCAPARSSLPAGRQGSGCLLRRLGAAGRAGPVLAALLYLAARRARRP